jgi:hypothetical protein
MSDSIRLVWGLVAVALVLALQYFRRKTITARWAFGSATALWLLAQFLPFQAAFAIQQRLSPQPAAANPVQIVFDASVGNASGKVPPVPGRMGRFEGPNVVLWLPLRAAGVGADQMLLAELATARIAEPGGKIVELGDERGFGENDKWFHYKPLWVPNSVYERVKDQPVRLEIDYSLTLLQANTHALPALAGSQRTLDAGWCATRRNPDDRTIGLGCLVPGKPPCTTPWFIENTRTGKRAFQDPEPKCDYDYAPYFARIGGDSLSRFSDNFWFFAVLSG